MTTSQTVGVPTALTLTKQDARYSSLLFTSQQLKALHIDPDPETGWGVMPGYDQTIPIPLHLEPPISDADETLPSLMHPSYPFGRPVTKGQSSKGKGMVGNLIGTVGLGEGSGEGDMRGSGNGRMLGERWDERGIREVLESEKKREIPPGMAVGPFYR
jgi:hypothetical protein